MFAAQRAKVKNLAKQTEQQQVLDDVTHCHENEYGEPEEQKPIGGALDVAGERREDNQDGMRQGAERVRRRAAQCGAKHGGRWLTSLGYNGARGLAAVRAVQ